MLDFSLDIVPGLPEQLGLKDNQHGTMRMIVAALLDAAERGKAVAYSRRKTSYSGKRRYGGRGFTYARIIKGVQILVDAGYVYSWIAPACSPREGRQGVQSTICATPKLIKVCKNIKIISVQHECIWLNGLTKKRINYQETELTSAMRSDIQEINLIMSTVDFNIAMDGVERNDRHIIIPHVTGKPHKQVNILIPYRDPRIRRTFCRESFECGGRLYGPWQGIPKGYRKRMTINGEPTAEPDFKSMHPKLAYGMAGCPLKGDFDIYDVDESINPKHYKYSLLIALNAGHPCEAIHAIQKKLSCTFKYAGGLYDEVGIRNWQIEKFIAKDKGVELQRIDSEIALEVIKACHRDGIPVLPVHDSFIVPERCEKETKKHMDRAWSKFVDTDSF
ncbi:hypothetical protein ACLBXB_08325 [Methylobacterium mesophilicum]